MPALGVIRYIVHAHDMMGVQTSVGGRSGMIDYSSGVYSGDLVATWRHIKCQAKLRNS